jgi:hypothetical protein
VGLASRCGFGGFFLRTRTLSSWGTADGVGFADALRVFALPDDIGCEVEINLCSLSGPALMSRQRQSALDAPLPRATANGSHTSMNGSSRLLPTGCPNSHHAPGRLSLSGAALLPVKFQDAFGTGRGWL